MRAGCASLVTCVKVSTSEKVAPQISIRRLSGMTGGEANFLCSLTLEGRVMPFFFGVQLAPSGRMVCVDCWHFRFRFKAD